MTADEAEEALGRVADVLETEAGERWGDPEYTIRSRQNADGPVERRLESPVDAAHLASFAAGELEAERELGGGGMGVVELSVQRSLQRMVAVKRLRSEDVESEELTNALLREAVHTGALEHPGIVPVYALGTSEAGSPLMVMKRVEGLRWSELIADPDHDAWWELRGDRLQHHVRFTIQLCRALEFAHSKGVIHRDVKPSNVLIGAFGEVILLDWGISIRVEEIPTRVVGMASGTPLYVAPEMLGLGSMYGSVGRHSDVYLLGGSLHHAITGRPPHRGATLNGLLASVVNKPPPEYGEDVPAELAAICRRALATHPDDRYPNCSVFRQALEDFLQHAGSVALAGMAGEELRAMRAELDVDMHSVAARTHFAAARVGLEQALRAWPDNPTAHAVLSEAVEQMGRAHVASLELNAARALQSKLEALGSERAVALRAQADELESRLADVSSERERLRRLDRDLDPTVGERERTLALRLLTGFVAVVASVMLIPKLFGAVAPPMLFAVASVVLVLVGGGVLFHFRSTFLRNRINRLMASLFAWLLTGVAVHRLYSLIRRDTVEQTIAGDGVVVGVLLGFASIVLRDKRLILPTALFIIFALVGAQWPDAGHIGMGVSVLTSVAWVTFSRRSAEPKGDPESGSFED